jgi:uncharacterized protein YqjF (DUF2071 family)
MRPLPCEYHFRAATINKVGMPTSRERVFLSADWLDLVMVNYEVDPLVLKNYVPSGTELDSFEGKTLISLVGFRFLRTRLFGTVVVPFHSDFDEVNLRLYVRRRHSGEDRRGVVFIREVVPKYAVAYIARAVYGEKYSCVPMRHAIATDGNRRSAEYEWQLGREWCKLYARAEGDAMMPAEGSLEQFITEHYWGYSAQRKGGCTEYHVRHDPWRVWAAADAGFQGDAAALYGLALAAVIRSAPHSAFIAEGSRVLVYSGSRVIGA